LLANKRDIQAVVDYEAGYDLDYLGFVEGEVSILNQDPKLQIFMLVTLIVLALEHQGPRKPNCVLIKWL